MTVRAASPQRPCRSVGLSFQAKRWRSPYLSLRQGDGIALPNSKLLLECKRRQRHGIIAFKQREAALVQHLDAAHGPFPLQSIIDADDALAGEFGKSATLADKF